MNNNTTYKDSPLGKIPSDWEVKKLGNFIHTIIGGGTPSRDQAKYWNGNIYWATVKDFTNFNPHETQERITEDGLKNSSSNLIPQGTIITPTRMALGKAVKFKVDVAINQDLKAIFPKKELDSDFLLFWFEKNKTKIEGLGNGSTVKGITLEDLKGIPFCRIPLPEQIRIAEVLSAWDKAISNLQATIEQVELRNKWLMQQLLTGKRRLKGFGDDKWKIKSLKEILIPVRKSLIPQKDELYQQIGIRSHTKGIFYKDKVSGATLGDKRVFWIEPNCFIVNIVFAWEHAIAKTTVNEIGMIASHRFPMFKPKDNLLDIDYLLYYFQSPRGKSLLGLASPGGAGRNKTLGQSEFINLQIPVPPLNEQTAIAQVLQAADKEVQILRSKLDKLKEQKKGLMQVLLTGKKRLKVD
ncbi:MAG: restriction endonuclease subunit S [Bacteroidota bacterium]|nr:restriction endonuclease subunit S [Bacteroidota bacterium]